MTVPKKSPDPGSPLKLIEIILIFQFHDKYLDELEEYGIDATQQLKEREIMGEIYNEILDLDFDQLIKTCALLPGSLTLRDVNKTTEQEKLFKELRQKYLHKNVSATLH